MNFSFEQQFSTSLNDNMPNFITLQQTITTNSPWNNDLILHYALHAVKYKIEATKMYILILNEIFELTKGDKNFLKRAMMENIIFNLSSLLDALAHTINRIYRAGVDFNRVQMDHQTNDKKCLRCHIDNINDDLSQYLNLDLPKRDQSQSHWYYDFSNYRNQMTHRTIYPIMLEPGYDYLPDDPSDFSPPTILKYPDGKPIFDPSTRKALYSNYTQFREFRSYSQEMFDKILSIIEKVCELLTVRLNSYSK